MLHFINENVPAMTYDEMENALRNIDHPDTDTIAANIISGVYNGIRYYALHNSGAYVEDPHMDEFEMFWDTEWDSEIAE